MNGKAVFLATMVIALLSGCGGKKAPVVVKSGETVEYVNKELEYSPVRFSDGEESLNDRCMVRQAKLSLRMPPIYVNGKPIGFC